MNGRRTAPEHRPGERIKAEDGRWGTIKAIGPGWYFIIMDEEVK